MMTLKEASRFFDDHVFTDTFGTASFKGQVLPFTDSVRSGESTRRRILEVGSTVVIPDERTVTETSGQVYIIAADNPDFFKGDTIRTKYPILPVSITYAIRTPGQILSASGGVTGVYAAPSFVRRVSFEEHSDYAGGFEMYLSSYYSITPGKIFHGSDSKYYRTRVASRVSDVGFSVMEVVEIESPIGSVTVQQKTGTVINPVTDDYTAATPITGVAVFVEKIKLDYQHEALGYVELKAGDRAISFLKTVVSTIKVGEVVGDYVVKSVYDGTDYWTVHGRKA